MDFFSLALLDKMTAVMILGAIALSVITDKLVWHTRLKEAKARADRWEKVALEALTMGARAGVRAAEVAVDVVSSLPDPVREKGGDSDGDSPDFSTKA